MKPGPDQRVPVGLDGTSHTDPPNQRSFSLSSDEAHAALCRRSEAWIPNGALPREPRAWDRPVIVEARRR